MQRFFSTLLVLLASYFASANPLLPPIQGVDEIRYAVELTEQQEALPAPQEVSSPLEQQNDDVLTQLEADAAKVPSPPNAQQEKPEELTEEELNALNALNALPSVEEDGVDSSDPFPQISTGTGIIAGEVFEAASGKGLPGVIVELPALGLSTRTDEQGKYRLEGIGRGSVELNFTKSGYLLEERTIDLLDTSSPFPLSIGMELRPVESSSDVFMMEEYEVVEDYVEEETGLDLILGQSEGASFVSGIGALEFSKAGVSDVAGALSKVSGASIVDGKYVVVRGLADRYVTTTMNGLPIISADSSRKAVQLDLLPTFMVNQINVDKTYSANKQGDFGGGAVDVVTKFIPEKRTIKLDYSWKSYSDTPDVFLYHSANEQSFLGGGEFQTAPDNGFVGPLSASFDGLLQQQSYVPRVGKSDLNQSVKFEYADVFDLTSYNPSGDELKIGYTLGYARVFEQNYKDQFTQTWADDSANPTYRARTDEYTTSFTETKYLGVSLEGGVLPDFTFGSYTLQDEQSLSFLKFDTYNQDDLVYNRFIDLDERDSGANYFDGQTTTVGDFYTGGNGEAFAIPTGRNREIETVVRELGITQLSGQHRFSLLEEDQKKHELTLSWGLSDTLAIENRPFGISSTSSLLDFKTGVNRETFLDDSVQTAFTDLINNTLSNPASPFYIGKPVSAFATWNEFKAALQEMITRQPTAAGIVNGTIDVVESELEKLQPGLESVESFGNFSEGGDNDTLRNKIEKSKVTHEMESTRFDGAYSYYFNSGTKLSFGMGISTLDQKRVSSGGAINYFPTGKDRLGDPLLDSPLSEQDLIDAVEDPDVFLERLFSRNDSNNLLSLDNSELSNYEGESSLKAQYWKIGLDFENTKVGFGLRREREKRSYKAIDRFRLNLNRDSFFNNVRPNPNDDGSSPLPVPQDVEGLDNGGNVVRLTNAAIAREFDNQYFLPSLYFTRSLRDERLNLGFYWSRTVARPTFFEFIPAKIANPDGFITRGQVVSDTQINNFDFSLSYRVSDSIRLGSAFFYKDLENPIYGLVLPEGDIFYRNADTAQLMGFEVDADIALTDYLSFKTNYTYIDGEFFYRPGVAGTSTDPLVSTLAEQPKHIFNAILGYERAGFSANLIYNYTGEYAALLRSVDGGPQYYRRSFGQFDLNLSKRFEFKTFDFSIKFGIQNLFAKQEEFYIESERFPRADGQTWKSSTRPRTYSLGGSITF